MNAPTAIIVPVLNRPAHVARTLEYFDAVTPEPHVIVFVADEDDDAELAALEAAGADHLKVPAGASYAQKVNAAYRMTNEPLLFMAADDLKPHRHWLDVAADHLDREGVSVVGTNDVANKRTMLGEHSTHTLFTRAYIEAESGTMDEPDVVLHEGYAHEYCDDEFVATAKHRGRYAHAFGSIVEHLHPIAGKAPMDDTYRRGQEHTRESRRLFRQRARTLWAPRA